MTRDGEAALAAAFAAISAKPRTLEHDAVFTVEEAAAVTGALPGQHTKNLFLKDRKGALFLLTAAEDAVVDLKTIDHVIGAKGRVSFGSAELLNDALGVAPGSVTPLALANDRHGRVAFAIDRTVWEADIVNVHPLRNTATTTLTQSDFRAFLTHVGCQPRIIDLA